MHRATLTAQCPACSQTMTHFAQPAPAPQTKCDGTWYLIPSFAGPAWVNPSGYVPSWRKLTLLWPNLGQQVWMLGETNTHDSQKAQVLIQFLISKFQPTEQSHAVGRLHHSRNTWPAFSHCARSVGTVAISTADGRCKAGPDAAAQPGLGGRGEGRCAGFRSTSSSCWGWVQLSGVPGQLVCLSGCAG